jgi:hypothetical protein
MRPDRPSRQLTPEEVRALRERIARTILDTTPREEWAMFVLDAEPETAAILSSYRAGRS